MAGFNVQKFQTHLQKTGTLQTNRFIVTIPNTNRDITDLLEYRAESVNIPGITLQTSKTKRYGVGPNQQFAHNVQFNDCSINFLDDGTNSIWKMLNNWMTSIFDYNSGGLAGSSSYLADYKDQYTTDIIVSLYSPVGKNDSDDQPVTTFVLKDAFPTTLGDVPLSWSDNNALFKVHCTFAYSEVYERESINETTGQTISSSQTIITDQITSTQVS